MSVKWKAFDEVRFRLRAQRDRLPWFWFFFTVAVLLLSAIGRYHIRHDLVRVRGKSGSVRPRSSAVRFLWGVHPIVRRIPKGQFRGDLM
jgi:hypothetical protein